MPFGEQTRQTLDQFGDMLPLWVDISLGFVILWGLFLWLFGSRLMRPSLAMIGLVGGGILGGLFAREMGSNEKVAMVIIGAGIVGGILAWVTFRLWIALLLAACAAIIAPCIVLVLEGTSAPDEADQPLRDAAREIADEGMARAGLADDASADDRAEPEDSEADDDDALAQTRADLGRLLERLAEAATQTGTELRTWWAEQVDPTVRWTATVVAVVMAITGIILGLIMPQLSAGLVTSLLGSVLVLACAGRLLHRYAPAAAEFWPDTPRSVMAVLAVATVLGGVLQWWNHRRAQRANA